MRTGRACTFFSTMAATATDYGHPTPLTADLPPAEADVLFDRVRDGKADADHA